MPKSNEQDALRRFVNAQTPEIKRVLKRILKEQGLLDKEDEEDDKPGRRWP